MPVTSLIPIALYPLLDVLSTEECCRCYMNDTIMVFIGGLTLAVAIEQSQLHMRIALGIMNFIGCSHSKLLGGIVACTTFLSMWVSNTAATAMMVPIIFAVLTELEKVPFLYLKYTIFANSIESCRNRITEPPTLCRPACPKSTTTYLTRRERSCKAPAGENAVCKKLAFDLLI